MSDTNIKKIGIDARLWQETGIGRYIRNLVLNLGEFDKVNTYVFFAKRADFEDIKLSARNLKFEIIECEIPWHSVREQLEFPRLLNKYQLDLMHFPYFSVPAFYNKPFVVTVHDLIMNHFPTGRATTLPLPFYLAKKFGYSVIIKNAILKSKKIITPSTATKQEILDHYTVASEKIAVTPEGIDHNIINFKPTIFKDKHPYFLYVGNAYPHKNVEKLIEAFLIFSEKHPEYVLRLAGKTDFFYKRLITQIKSPKIEFLGYVSDSDLAKLYTYSKATCVPSRMEGFGLTVLEAMSMGSLVICSEIPSLKEIAGENAIFFNPQDVLSIAGAMEQVTSMTLKERDLVISSSKKHIQKYSWKNLAKETIDVYNSCLTAKN